MNSLPILAGIVGSDGHLEKNQAVIRVINKNEDFIKSVVIPLIQTITGKNVKAKFVPSGFGTGKFVVAFTSQMLWRELQERFNIPTGKKSESIQSPNLQNKEEKLDFISGWFAGDGSVTTDGNGRNKPRLTIWSKSRVILDWIKEVLQENQIESRIWFAKKKNEFLLTIGTQNSIQRFHQKITIPHPEKENRLKLLLS